MQLQRAGLARFSINRRHGLICSLSSYKHFKKDRMDLLLTLQTHFLSVITITLVLFFIWRSRREKGSASYVKMPPGPAPVPVFGNYFQVRVKEPYKYYLELSKTYGSVFTLWLGRKPVVVISGYQALKDSLIGLGEEFSGRANYPLLLKVSNGQGVMVNSGERWKQLRRFCLMTMKNFGMGRHSIEDKVKEEARHLVQEFRTFGDSAFNPKHLLTSSVSNVICSIIFGQRFTYDDPKCKLFIETVDAYFSFINSTLGQAYNIFPKFVSLLPGVHHDMLAKIEKARAYIKLEAEARMKRLHPCTPQDFIEAFLIRMKEQEQHNPDTEFNFESLLSTVWNLFSAGTETTSSTLRQALLLLMKHPDIQAKVQKEIDAVVGPDRCPGVEDRQNMSYTNAVIHEIQRVTDLAPTAVPHKMMCDTEFNNYLIPEGTMVLPLLSSVLSDPELWKNPKEFDPENFLNKDGGFKKNDAFVVFGMGKRACLGESLARVELFITITSLLQHFTFKATQPPEELDTTPAICSFGRMPRSYECYALPRTKSK